MIAHDRKVVLITRHTLLEELINRYHTLDQARFYLDHLGIEISEYEQQHQCYLKAKAIVVASLEKWGRFQVIDRSFLPNFLFGAEDIVMVLGPDGLVANTMKYLTGQPLIGINPDPSRYDGVLLPFVVAEINQLLPEVAQSKRQYKEITMAKASLTDGQILYAVNDLFIGCKTHVSARYELAINGQRESQSSSGVIVSTGLGATGWMKSITTGAMAIAKTLGAIDKYPTIQDKDLQSGKSAVATPIPPKLTWHSKLLQFAVREPFPSQRTAANLVTGFIEPSQLLIVTSHMPENGVIFSDGIESDFLTFGAGVTAKVEVAERVGLLVS